MVYWHLQEAALLGWQTLASSQGHAEEALVALRALVDS